MPMPLKNLIGQRFGRLVVLGMVGRRITRRRRHWTVRCDCGVRKIVAGAVLRRGHAQSCGCLRREATIQPHIKHGEGSTASKTAEYRIWAAMRNRCNNPNEPRFADYGGRGIKICTRWSDYKNFLADMGRRPSTRHSLDRYPDNDGNYEPENCRWATPKQQRANQRRRARIDQFSDAELRDELRRRARR